MWRFWSLPPLNSTPLFRHPEIRVTKKTLGGPNPVFLNPCFKGVPASRALRSTDLLWLENCMLSQSFEPFRGSAAKVLVQKLLRALEAEKRGLKNRVWPHLEHIYVPNVYVPFSFSNGVHPPKSNSSSWSQRQGHYPWKIPRTPAKPAETPQNPRRDPRRGPLSVSSKRCLRKRRSAIARMRQKCVRNASKMRPKCVKVGLVRNVLKCVRNASKLRQNAPKMRGTPLGENTFWTMPTLEPSERQISSESLAEGCALRMVTLRNSNTKPLFRVKKGGWKTYGGGGGTYHETPPQKRLQTPLPMIRFPPPFVQALLFSPGETDTDQTNPTF